MSVDPDAGREIDLTRIAHTKPHERRGLFRRNRADQSTGSVAVTSEVSLDTVDVIEETDPGLSITGEYLLGLEDTLTTFVDAKRKLDNVIRDHRNNSDGKAALFELIQDSAIHQLGGADRHVNRTAQKLAERDYSSFSALYLMSAKLRAVAFSPDGNEAYHRIMGRQYVDSIDLLDASRELDGNIDLVMDDAEGQLPRLPGKNGVVKELFEDFRQKATKPYCDVFESQAAVLETVDEKLTTPTGAIEVLESVKNAFNSELPQEDALLKILATTSEDPGLVSRLDVALEVVRQSAEDGAFAKEFIDHIMTGGDDTLSFLRETILQSTDVDIAEILQQSYAKWPEGLQKQYDAFKNERLREYQSMVTRINNTYSRKDMIVPRLEYAKKLYLDFMHDLHSTNNKPKQSNGKVLKATDELGGKVNEVEIQREPAEVSGVEGQTDPQDIVLSLLDKKFAKNDELVQKLANVVASLSRWFETSPGVIRGKSAKINGLKVYAVELKPYRIVFTQGKGKVTVHGVFADHDDYQRFVHNFTS